MSLSYIIGSLCTSNSPIPPLPPVPGELIYDNFPSGVISGKWVVPAGQTISVDGDDVEITGSGTTKDASKLIYNIGYWQSTLRNYTTQLEFKIKSIGANTKGVYVGVSSTNNSTIASNFVFSAVALLDYSGTPTLQIICPDSNNVFKTPAQTETTVGLPPINTSDRYRIEFSVNEQRATATLTNLTTVQSVSITYDYISNTPNSGVSRPNIFYYSFGICASTHISIQSFLAKTTEIINPWSVFVGDSITTGYCGNLFIDTYAYVLRNHASVGNIIQVMAGGGNNLFHVENNMSEILRIDPTNVFLNIGTNAFGSFETDYLPVGATIINSGINLYPLAIGVGGNPLTSGTFNYKIKNAYPANFIDLWTNGWNTMTIPNGDMVDSLHPSTQGHLKLANLIKTLKPALFPL
jgi:hypothetical protein